MKPPPSRAAATDAPLSRATQGTGSARFGCLPWVVLLLLVLVPLIALIVWWMANTTETVFAEVEGEGWTAFVRRVDYAFPADSDASIWLARSRHDRSTWHRLAPTHTAWDVAMEWTSPRHLRIDYRGTIAADFVRAVDDVVIEWR